VDTLPGEAEPLFERLARARRTLESERNEAPRLCAELLGLPLAEQRRAAAEESRFHKWGICELLLARSTACRDSDPRECGRLAELGLAAAEHLDLDAHAPPVASDLKARLWAAVGEAARRAGETRRAEEALARAAACLAHGTGDLLLDAQLLEFEAEIRGDQGRAGEADALLKQAAARYAALHEDELYARALARRARLRAVIDRPLAALHLGYGSAR
jgi:hypothetical protein